MGALRVPNNSPSNKPLTLKYLSVIIALAMPLAADSLQNNAQAAVPDANLTQVEFGTVVNGKPVDAKSLKGKVVVLDFWGVNCPLCLVLMPEMAKLAKSETAKGLTVIGMESQRGTQEEILPFLKKFHIEYPVTMGGNSHLPFEDLPSAAVYGVDGKLVWLGHADDEGFMPAVSKALLKVKTVAASPAP